MVGAPDSLANGFAMSMKPIFVFVALAYALSIALGLVIGLTFRHESALIDVAYSSMFFPAVSALIVSATMNEPFHICWDRFPIKYFPLALFLIPGVLHAVMFPLMAAMGGGVRWQDWLTPQSDGLYHTPAFRGWGTITIYELVGHIAVNAFVGLMIVSFLASFEEVGWRAWLLPRLIDRLGARHAVLVSAIIWALCHVPFQLSGISILMEFPRSSSLSSFRLEP